MFLIFVLFTLLGIYKVHSLLCKINTAILWNLRFLLNSKFECAKQFIVA